MCGQMHNLTIEDHMLRMCPGSFVERTRLDIRFKINFRLSLIDATNEPNDSSELFWQLVSIQVCKD